MKKFGLIILLVVVFFLISVPAIVFAEENYDPENQEVAADTLSPRVINAFPPDCSYISTSDGESIKEIEIKFSEEVYLDDELSYKNISFVDKLRNKIEVKLEKTEDYIDEGKVILIKPVTPLKCDTVYVVNLLDNFVKDEAANPSKPYIIRFVTQGDSSENIKVNWEEIGMFPDVKSTHWAREAILYMAKNGVVAGYPDGKFRPNESVTREQLARMMVEALDLPINMPDTPTFKDVDKENWSYKYVESAKQYLAGFTMKDGSYYRGTQNVTREDIAFALVEAKGYIDHQVDTSKLSSIFKDTDKLSAEKKRHILIAYEKNLISGYSDNTFRPEGPITRAEAAQVLYNVLFPYSDNDSGNRGNTIGNLVNGGMAAEEDGWIYFSNKGDSSKLYKMKADGTEKIKMDDLSCEYINVVDGWIYFIAGDAQNSAPIYKMKVDGTGKTDVGNDDCSEIVVIGSWIYYTTGSELCKMRTDGTHKTLINTGLAYDVNVVGDWIYYNGGDSGYTYKIRVNGTNNTLLNYGSSICMNVAGDSIYYVNYNDDKKIYKMNNDGTGNTSLGLRAKDVNNSLNVSGDWIYYLEEPDTLYKAKIDGSGRTKIAENAFGSICIVDDWIYFTVQDSQDMHKINIDGTERSSAIN